MKPTSVIVLAPVLVLAAACGASQVHQAAATGKLQPRSGGGAAATHSTHHHASGSTSAGSSSAGACSTKSLSLSLGSAGHGAGSTYQPIVFTNTGSAPCTLTGYPGVSYVAPDSGKQVGAAAARNSHLSVTTVTLASGAHASAMLQIVNHLNFPKSSCDEAPVAGVRVYPPGETAAAFVPFASGATACSSDVEQLTIQAVVAGSSGE